MTNGPSIADKCTASGDGLTSATVGKLAYVNIQSRDSVGNIIDNTADNYELYFKFYTSPSVTWHVNDFYVTASYTSNGLY